MGRLFVTSREIDLINDWNKEIVKDVIGHKIFYYSISEKRTKIHELYLEAPEKVVEAAVEIEALVSWQPEEAKTNVFGHEELSTIEIYIQYRDLLDKEIKLQEGDFFSFGHRLFEVTSVIATHNIFGQVEHLGGFNMKGRQARQGQFVTKIQGPTREEFSDPDAVQETFVQQRGFEENRLGETGDKRDLQEKGVLDKPLPLVPAEVSPKGTDSEAGSSFYDEFDG